MKRKIIPFFIGCAMLLAPSFSFAQTPVPYDDFETVNVYSTNDWIDIDGVDNEAIWSSPSVQEQPIGKVLHDIGVDPVANSYGFAASYKAVRDDNYLYLFVKVTDNTYVPYNTSLMTGEYNIDNIELFFFPDPTDKNMVYDNADARPRGLSQLRVSVGNTNNRATGGGYAMGFAINNAITGFEYATTQTPTGYNVEIVVPWDIVVADNFVGNLNEGNKILFDVNIGNCLDYLSNRVILLGWSGDDFQTWRWNPKMGEMAFAGEALTAGVENVKAQVINHSFNNGMLKLRDVQNNVNVQVYDLCGALVKSTMYNGQDINLSNVSSGAYLVKVGNLGQFKILK